MPDLAYAEAAEVADGIRLSQLGYNDKSARMKNWNLLRGENLAVVVLQIMI